METNTPLSQKERIKEFIEQSSFNPLHTGKDGIMWYISEDGTQSINVQELIAEAIKFGSELRAERAKEKIESEKIKLKDKGYRDYFGPSGNLFLILQQKNSIQ